MPKVLFENGNKRNAKVIGSDHPQKNMQILSRGAMMLVSSSRHHYFLSMAKTITTAFIKTYTANTSFLFNLRFFYQSHKMTLKVENSYLLNSVHACNLVQKLYHSDGATQLFLLSITDL
jgi:hypothetical protein